MLTPPAIVPEWYLLPFYAILRSIPNKLLGVIAMFSAIFILLVTPFTDSGRIRGFQFIPLSKLAFVCNYFINLMQLLAKYEKKKKEKKKLGLIVPYVLHI